MYGESTLKPNGNPGVKGVRFYSNCPAAALDRASRSRWENKGALALEQRAHREVERLLESYEPSDLPEDIKKDLVKLMNDEARRHGQDNLPHLPQ
ncbi:MAG: hypothetical protein GY774_31420 [Planctomycetes bacterium]|nr:hypothetical protein [Planctomycetota bacterium]